jgi:small subunit ribosomal protein S1
VHGVIFNQVKGGFTVDLDGAVAFLPRSQVDIRPIRDVGPLMNNTQPFQILKMDRRRGNIVVSRRTVLEETRAEQRQELVQNLEEGQVIDCVVKNITDYGAFVELEPGIEGLIHVSEMSWTKKNIHPGKIVSTSQEVEVQVLEVDPDKRRISLGLKQTLANPWETFADKYPVGSTIEGEVKNKTEFGLFIGLDGDVDGMVHLSDLDWNKPGEQALDEYSRGDVVKAKVLDVDVDKERISLGIKQLGNDPVADAGDAIRKNAVVTGVVTEVNDGGIEVRIEGTELTAFIRRADLSRDRNDQRPERFAKGDKVDARVTQVDRKTGKVSLSIKALEIAEEKEAVAAYGSSDSGASLGDILGAALKDREKK